MCLVSVVFEGLSLEFSVQILSDLFFGVSGFLPELFGVVVFEIKPLVFLAVRSLSRN